MNKESHKDGRRNNRPPAEHQFKPGQSGNPLGRPRKRKSTFEDEIKAVFGKEREITIDGQTEVRSMRQLILEQIARGAAQGDPKMLRIALPFLKIIDDSPEFEVLPEDKQIINDFIKCFNEDGSEKNED